MEEIKIIELYFDRDESAIKETEALYGKLCTNIAKNTALKRLEYNGVEKRSTEITLSFSEIQEVLTDSNVSEDRMPKSQVYFLFF